MGVEGDYISFISTDGVSMCKRNGLSFARAFRQSPLCHRCTNVHNCMHIGAFCSQHQLTHNNSPSPSAGRSPDSRQGGSRAVAIARGWLWHRGAGGSTALLWHDRGSCRHRHASTARHHGCDEDTGSGQRGVIGRSTAVGRAVAAAAACR